MELQPFRLTGQRVNTEHDYMFILLQSFVVCRSEWNRPHVFIYTPQKIKIMSDAALQMCDVIQQPSVRPHPVSPSSLQLPNQTRMESGPEVISQSSSLLPISGFPMQVRTSSWKLQNQKWFSLWNRLTNLLRRESLSLLVHAPLFWLLELENNVPTTVWILSPSVCHFEIWCHKFKMVEGRREAPSVCQKTEHENNHLI